MTSESGDRSAVRSANGKSLIFTDPTGTYELAYTAASDATLRWDGDDLLVVDDTNTTRITKSAGKWKVVVQPEN